MGWSIVGVTSATPVASGNISVTEPSGVAEGDLLIATISFRGTAAFTLPSGWTLVGTQQTSGNTSTTASSSIASGLMAYCVRGASAPGLTFTRSSGDVALASVVAYRSDRPGAITYAGGSAVTLAANATATSHPGVTTTRPMGLVVRAICGAETGSASSCVATNPGNSSGTLSTTTAPTRGRFVERVDAGTTTGADGSLAIADGVRPAAGATGAITYTHSVNSRHVVIAAAFDQPVRVGSGDATWDPDNCVDVDLTNSNLTSTNAASTDVQYQNWVRGTHGKNAGKWYWELTVTTASHTSMVHAPGWMADGHDLDQNRDAADLKALYWDPGGHVDADWTTYIVDPAPTWTAGNTLCFAADLDANPPKFWFRVGSGQWNASGTADPATGTGGGTHSALAGETIYPFWTSPGTSSQAQVTVNFGTAVYSVPSGYSVYNAALPTITGSAAQTLSMPTGAAAGAPKVTGTAAHTLAMPTGSAAGSDKVTGAAAQTLAMPANAAAGSSKVTGAAAQALPLPSGVAAGAPTVAGSAAQTLAMPTSSSEGSGRAAGSAAQTLAMPTSAAAGTSTVTGLSNRTITPNSVAAGTSKVTGSAAQTLSMPTGAAAGSDKVTGSAAQTLAMPTGSAAGSVTVSGAHAETLAEPSGAAAGTSTVTGEAGQILDMPTQVATGATGEIGGVTGSADQLLDLPASVAEGSATILGEAAQTGVEPSGSAEGAPRVVAEADQLLDMPSQVATGSTGTIGGVTGSADQLLQSPQSAAEGVSFVSGMSAQVLDEPATSATGTATIAGSAAQVLPMPVSAAEGSTGEPPDVDTVFGSAAQILAMPVSVATGRPKVRGQAAQILPFPTQVATGVVTAPDTPLTGLLLKGVVRTDTALDAEVLIETVLKGYSGGEITAEGEAA